MSDENPTRKRSEVNWSRFGLAENVQRSKQHVKHSDKHEGNGQGHNQHVRELFDEEVHVFFLFFLYLPIK